MPRFGRVVTAMVTPFTADGSADLDGARTLAEHLVSTGTETILVAGTTGESPTLTDDEVWAVLNAVNDAVGDRAMTMVGTGTNSTARTIAATEQAADRGADAVLLVTPYYNKPSQAGLLAHFSAAAGATELPVVLYDIPARTAREIATDTLVALAQVPNIVAVKDAVGDLAKLGTVFNRTRGAEGGFEIYSGDDINFLPMLAVGAVGIVSVAAHVAGQEMQEIARSADGDLAKARELHLRLLPFFEALMTIEPSPAGVKGLLNRRGLPAGPVRPPLAAASSEVVDRIAAAARDAGLEP
ncbi:MAG TPA: 4-hydroxy-tetrahydrodipicolinate synthase [Nitriliruptorales bacterium]